MNLDELERIRSWDARCGDNELVFLPVTLDRRRLLEYVDELRVEVALLSTRPMRQASDIDPAPLPRAADSPADSP
jgi:hypothetical protein